MARSEVSAMVIVKVPSPLTLTVSLGATFPATGVGEVKVLGALAVVRGIICEVLSAFWPMVANCTSSPGCQQVPTTVTNVDRNTPTVTEFAVCDEAIVVARAGDPVPV